ncbi:methenyltetrahydrofolate synthase domain-containing protein isoform X2 [Petromyzon marinus]|uniref:methenyltetrahydrofolate synthase domain-containing protein isoform X2 n=1 Tax=Petromyzon marinus TaxID=7757 RepID=UPI003F720E62
MNSRDDRRRGVAVATELGTSKWDIRQTVWDYMELHDLANFPRPVHHRIPNFKGSTGASARLGLLPQFSAATIVKVNPDKPQEGARYLALEARKTLLVPTPRLRSGLFNRIVPPAGASKADLHRCATSQGVREFSVPLGLDAGVHVDLVVVGSVAVSERGWRIGKGEGFADMEFAMMACTGAVDDATVVVTCVHDCQVVDIPEELVETHDLKVDYILTPTRVIRTNCSTPKPRAIIWSKIDRELLTRIPILNTLRAREERLGRDVSLKDAPSLDRAAASAGTPGDPSASLHRETVGVGPAGTAAATRVRRGGSVSARGRRGGGGRHWGRGGGGWARQPIGGGGSGFAVPDPARGLGGGGGDGM